MIGNYYTTLHPDAWAVAEHVAANLPTLKARTVEFVRDFLGSDVPDVVKEAALFNLAHLRTQTCFRTPDGRFFGWEGGHNERVQWDVLSPGSWDADRDGVMEGCQHNALDTEYYGPNPLMAGSYLVARRAAERTARHLGDRAFADDCAALATRGAAWVDANLFNGQHYEQQVRDLKAGEVDPRLAAAKDVDLTDPPYQLGSACLVDQLVGLLVGRVAGIEGLLDSAHVRATLRTIHRHNYLRSMRSFANHMRTFALGDEAGTLMDSYPRGPRPAKPFPYYTEVMTGFEYVAASHMLYYGW